MPVGAEGGGGGNVSLRTQYALISRLTSHLEGETYQWYLVFVLFFQVNGLTRGII